MIKLTVFFGVENQSKHNVSLRGGGEAQSVIDRVVYSRGKHFVMQMRGNWVIKFVDLDLILIAIDDILTLTPEFSPQPVIFHISDREK